MHVSGSGTAITAGEIHSQAGKTLTVADYHSAWEAWAKAAEPDGREERDVAVIEMKACLEYRLKKLDFSGRWIREIPELLPPDIEELDATNCDLVILPEDLPHSLKRLRIRNSSNLTRLPESLPPDLESIDASNTGLLALPLNFSSLQKLIWLNISNCKLVGALENLPSSLQKLNASCNLQITGLTRNLPPGLIKLDVSFCQLESLPQSILNLPSSCVIDIEDNPLSYRILENLRQTISSNAYNGPTFRFSMAEENHTLQNVNLNESVAKWYKPEEKNSVEMLWSDFEHESNSNAFATFLQTLTTTQSAKLENAFNQQVTQWLDNLSKTPTLREQTFAMSLGATATCEDRVAQTYCQMRRAETIHELANCGNDKRLPEFIAAARQMFRQQKLEEIAQEKVSTLKFVDEIEVYLAYPVKLTQRLKLNLVPNYMRFFDVSYVTEDDLERAALQVKQLENETFPAWLSQWDMWKNFLGRIAPESSEKAKEKLYSALEDFDSRINGRLADKNLQSSEEDRIIEGKRLMDEVTAEIDWQLTKEVLTDKNSIQLLSNVWDLNLSRPVALYL